MQSQIYASDFHLFGLLRKKLAGKKFAVHAATKRTVTSWVKTRDIFLLHQETNLGVIVRMLKCEL